MKRSRNHPTDVRLAIFLGLYNYRLSGLAGVS